MLLLAAAGRPTTTAVPLEEQVRELQAGEHRCCKGQAVRGRRFEAVSCYEPMEMLPKTVADAASRGRQCYRRPSPNLPAGNWRC